MIRRKGQLGMGITWPVVFIFLVVLVSASLILSISIHIFGIHGQVKITSGNDKPILLRTFSIEGKEYTILEGMSMLKHTEAERDLQEQKIFDAIKKEAEDYTKSKSEEGDYCVILYTGIAYFFADNGKAVSAGEPKTGVYDPRTQKYAYTKLNDFHEIKASMPEGDKTISFYEGECL